MVTNTQIAAVSIDDSALTLEELARACVVEPAWIVERVEAGLLGGRVVAERTQWRFASAEVVRARYLVWVERDLDANPELAALVADLSEEVRRLRRRLRAAGLAD